jgi:hypothetical protein
MTLTCTGLAIVVVHLTCTTPEIQVDAARWCRIAQPITYSRQDTAETRRQVRAHNAKWTALCGGDRR